MKVSGKIEKRHRETFSRRRFLGQAMLGMSSLAVLSTGCSSTKLAPPHGQVMTVLGPINPEDMGTTLPHEHVLVDFVGAAQVSRERYHPDEVFAKALPHLERVRG